MSSLFHEFLYRPLLNTLIALYGAVAFRDLGIAIIILTILIRFLLYPIFKKSYRQQALMRRIHPHVKKIQSDHKHDREKQAQAMMHLYKEHGVNPLSGFFLLLIQLPVLIALYQVFLKGISGEAFEGLYSFVRPPGEVSHLFLGLINLQEPSTIIVGLAVVAQYLQGKWSVESQKQEGAAADPAARMAKQMVYVGPLLTLLFLAYLPSAIGLYILTTTLFSIAQQAVVKRSIEQQYAHGRISDQSENDRGARRVQ